MVRIRSSSKHRKVQAKVKNKKKKRNSSPTSAWYPHRRIDINDHSAHSIVFFEETLDSSKSETKLDSPDMPTLDTYTNICKTSNEDTEHDSLQDESLMQHLWQPDTLSHMGSVQDESGTLVFESSR
ncbi:hypothetical protein HOLleu_44711 [Holothuria leucospilota]|uniref:Uncharacterized protein n=1 Tax=Holothuria leucospilota TaxID=206669 RepID=A0A9Q0YAG6_HOLLE|nr:hypothetical protein HOLleu_44711 [Holothuria leucospilota]